MRQIEILAFIEGFMYVTKEDTKENFDAAVNAAKERFSSPIYHSDLKQVINDLTQEP